MATYVIGDVQGCFTTLERLLARLDWQPARDTLWFTGDLVNRGPRSLDTLRWAAAQGDRVVSVLGNHDLHLLRAAAGLRQPRPNDTLGEILAAPDRDALLGWLRARPLVHVQDQWLLVHAGLWPTWEVGDALALSQAVQAELARGDDLLAAIGDFRLEEPDAQLASPAKLRAATILMTTLRMIGKRGDPLRYAGPPGEAPKGAYPWYAAPARRWRGMRVLFGHWAAHGVAVERETIALDSGCVWGRELTALCLETQVLTRERAADGAAED